MRNLISILLFILIFVVVVGNTGGQRIYDALNPFDGRGAEKEESNGSLLDRVFNEEADDRGGVDRAPSSGSSSESPLVTSKEVEEKAKEVLKTLDELEEEEKVSELFTPRSPFAGRVTLKAGNAKQTDKVKEYVELTANTANTSDVNITGWYLESYVTESEAKIPLGKRYLEDHRYTDKEPIWLKPGETALVTTGDTPITVSFRENKCTGYLDDIDDYYPALSKRCPLAPDELLVYGKDVDEDDEECGEFVESISRCEWVSTKEINDAPISSSCESFVKRVLDYPGCVERHDEDADFYTGGKWRIYLGEGRELWRSADEIIRLVDKEGRVVDVVEY